MYVASSEKPVEKPTTYKNLGNPILVIAWTLVIFVSSQILALIIAEALMITISGQRFSESILTQSVPAQFFYIMLAETIAIGSVLLLLKRRRAGLESLGLGRRPRWSDIGLAAAGFVIFIITLIVVTAILMGLWPGYDTDQAQDVGFKLAAGGPEKFIAFISLVILPPIGEEVVMRGYLYGGLRARWNFLAAGLVTSILFGAAHLLTGESGLLWSAGINTLILSIFLVYLREKTGALYAGILLHALNNLLAFFVYFNS